MIKVCASNIRPIKRYGCVIGKDRVRRSHLGCRSSISLEWTNWRRHRPSSYLGSDSLANQSLPETGVAFDECTVYVNMDIAAATSIHWDNSFRTGFSHNALFAAS